LNTGITYNDFRFLSYTNNTNDYSGNQLTGVPEYVLTTDLKFDFPYHIYLFSSYCYTSQIPLSDDNLTYSEPYNLLRIKAGKIVELKKRIKLEAYALVDNVLNETYSLGNDLNAASGRYFNAAPPRNLKVGITIQF
jgi:iron complex outermembrane receptor protein